MPASENNNVALQPAPGHMDLNLAKLRVVNALLKRWQVDGDAARPALVGDGDSC